MSLPGPNLDPGSRPHPRRPSQRAALRVLTVFTDTDTRTTVNGWLAGDGHAVRSAMDGAEANLALRRERFDVVVCGADTLHTIRRTTLDPAHRVPESGATTDGQQGHGNDGNDGNDGDRQSRRRATPPLLVYGLEAVPSTEPPQGVSLMVGPVVSGQQLCAAVRIAAVLGWQPWASGPH